MTDFLYPFLDRDEADLASVLSDVEASTVQKGADVIALRRAIDLEAVESCAGAMRERLSRGGRAISFGNGGSATDAADFAGDLSLAGWRAIALTDDVATITAVGNDVGFDNIFARQVIAYGKPGDVAVAISTSGGSRNVLAAVEEARKRGLLTVALAGYGGGRLSSLCDRVHIISADYIPRIQEAQATQYHVLCGLLGKLLDRPA